VVAKDAVPFHGGTSGSNPACSSGESGANLISRIRAKFPGVRIIGASKGKGSRFVSSLSFSSDGRGRQSTVS
jgi:hypothetical protein